MTKAQLNKKVASTLNAWVAQRVAMFYDHVKRYGEVETRRRWREEYGLVFRRQYTVQARFFHYKEFPWRDLPASTKKTLTAQKPPQKRKPKVTTKRQGSTEEQLERYARQSTLN
jgi:hypothetical protein